MRADQVTINTVIYTTLIKGFSKVHRLDKALEVFEVMKKRSSVYEESSGPDLANAKVEDQARPNNVTYNSMIDCCIRCGDFARA
jgi:pentatricopeptide repeat protein